MEQLPSTVGEAVAYSIAACLVLVPAAAIRHPISWLAFGAAVGVFGYKKGTLSRDGAYAAAVVGAVTLSSSFPFACALLAFYLSSSKLTAFGATRKAAVEAEYKPGGSRNAVQVLANAGVPTALSFVYTELAARAAPVEATAAVAAAVIAYYACCCGDTWSSEIGVLSPQAPVLITTGKPVTPGTNGGVTLLGFTASACGGLFIGVIAALAAAVMGWGTTMDGVRVAGLSSRIIIVIAFLAGLLGSVADSLLGATVQYTGVDDATGKVYNKPNVELPGGRKLRQVAGHDWASNSMVNFMTATLSALLALVLVA